MDIRDPESLLPFAVEISPEHRRILYDWLAKVNTDYFKDPESIYDLGVEICEKFFIARSFKLPLNLIQCAGCAALWIAHKLESWDDSVHPICDYLYISGDAFSKDELIEMERDICYALNFRLYNPVAFEFMF